MRRELLMRKLLCVLLTGVFLLVGTVFTDTAYAGNRDEKGWPPGLAKKINCFNVEFNKWDRLFGFRLTRAELAQSIAEKQDDFEDFKVTAAMKEKVTDWNAIPQDNRKAVAYVITQGTMKDLYTENSKGKIVFQPNKNVTVQDILQVMGLLADKERPAINEATYKGTVQMIEKIGNRTWVVLKTANGLYSGYFTEQNKPDGLKEGLKIRITVDKLSDKILESKVTQDNETASRNLLSANQSNVEINLSGFSAKGFNISSGAQLLRNTNRFWQGKAALQVKTTGGNNWQGVSVEYDGEKISGAHTFSCYVMAPKGTPLRLVAYDPDNRTYPAGGVLEFVASGDWERKAVTFTPTASTDELSLQVTLNNSAQKVNFCLDGLQLEKGNVVTAWQVGK